MPQLEFFRNSVVEDPAFFDEGPKVVATVRAEVHVNTSSINTSTFDAYRQGVELTHQKYFDAGTIKIHAGEPGHVLKKNRYGMDKYIFGEDPWFSEMDYFDPVTFLEIQDNDDSLGGDVITFPIVVGDNDQLDNYIFNGVIEPLTIRAKVSFFSIEAPFESHDVRGAVMNGNTDITFASDAIQTIYTFDPTQRRLPFYDQYVEMMMFDSSSLGGSNTPTQVGYFRNEKVFLTPFTDNRFIRDSQSLFDYDASFAAALSLMTGSTGNYIDSTTRNQRSAPTGWDYDRSVNIGTDSLAFGGMTY